MEADVKVSGTWQKAQSIHAKVSGAWQAVQSGWVKVSGVWQQFYSAINALIHDFTVSGGQTGVSTVGRYRLNSSGVAEQKLTNGGSYSTVETWLVAGSASDFEARATVTSGSLGSGTAGTWLALSTTREWTKTAGATSFASVVFTLEIRRVSDGVVLTTATITIDVDDT